MRFNIILVLCAALSCALPLPCRAAAGTHDAATFQPFRSEAGLTRFLKKKRQAAVRDGALPAPAESIVVTGSTTQGIKYEGATNVETLLNNLPAAFADSGSTLNSITNNQEAMVDEGDIVKLHGDVLVILRRGRLFTVSLRDGGLKPVDAIDAYPPGVKARDDWYDEMLIAGDRVVVIGYSYARRGTEVNRFRIDAGGHLAFVDAHQLGSDDYYSSVNYASRLIGHKLILYSPRYLGYGDPFEALPSLRHWDANAKDGGRFRRIGSARRAYLPPGLREDEVEALHTVMSCDVTAADFACEATSLFGPEGRNFYVSVNAVYVWTIPGYDGCWAFKARICVLYRLPLDGSAPSAVGVRGSPVDQFSFREDAAHAELDVLVVSDGDGEGMWSAERARGAVALARIPFSAFGGVIRSLDPARYRKLPAPAASAVFDFHNRFAGDYVLYGRDKDWGAPKDAAVELIAASVRGDGVTRLSLPHGIGRLELMGPNAVAVGSDKTSLYFSSILLGGPAPALGDRYMLPTASQAETRSHGFFFKPERGDAASGTIGLPVARPASPAYRQLFDDSAAVTFLRYVQGRFARLGELASHPETATDDKCVASCVDWYGNARPIFAGDRVIALMGYEMVEGRVEDGGVREVARIDFAPR